MYWESTGSIKMILDEMLSNETKLKLWVLITEPGGSVTDERLKSWLFPKALGTLKKYSK